MNQEIENKRNEKNVILLNMSTLPPFISNSHYYFVYKDEKREYRIDGNGQLEPGSKLIISQLANEGKKVDRIIILASVESRGNNEEHNSACDFYKDRIKKWIKGDESSSVENNYEKISDIKENLELYVKKKIIIKLKKSNNKISYKDLKDFCNDIGKKFKDKYSKINFVNNVEEYQNTIQNACDELLNDSSFELEKLKEYAEKYKIKDYMKRKEFYFIFKDRWLRDSYSKLRYQLEVKELESQQNEVKISKYEEMIKKLDSEIDYLKTDKSKLISSFIESYAFDYCKKNGAFERTQIDVMKKIKDIYFPENEEISDDSSLDNLFKIIELEKAEYIQKLISLIKFEENKETPKVNLYIDMQGGDRNTIADINAITQLLSDQNVEVKKRYAIEYDRNKIASQINEVSEKYNNYELITAMDSFKKYGRGDNLVSFFGKDEKAKGLVEVIDNASKAISLCQANQFDESVQRIFEFIQKYEKHGKGDKNYSKIDIVLKDIENDYRKLNVHDETIRYIEQILWCLKKGFIQQALTIFEAKIPTVIVKSGLLYYAKKDDEENILDAIDKINEIRTNNSFIRERELNDINHVFIKNIVRYTIKKLNYKPKNKNVLKYKKGKDKDSPVIEMNAYSELNFSKFQYKFVNNVLMPYYELADYRNEVNHSNDDNNPTYDDIAKKIKKTCEKILELKGEDPQVKGENTQVFVITKQHIDNKKNGIPNNVT